MVQAVPQHLFARVPRGGVVLHRTTGVCYALNPVGVQVWAWIQQPCRIEELLRRLLEEFESPPAEARQDLLDLLQELLTEGLIRLSHACER